MNEHDQDEPESAELQDGELQELSERCDDAWTHRSGGRLIGMSVAQRDTLSAWLKLLRYCEEDLAPNLQHRPSSVVGSPPDPTTAGTGMRRFYLRMITSGFGHGIPLVVNVDGSLRRFFFLRAVFFLPDRFFLAAIDRDCSSAARGQLPFLQRCAPLAGVLVRLQLTAYRDADWRHRWQPAALRARQDAFFLENQL